MFYVIPKFIFLVTVASHWSLFWANPVHILPSCFLSIHFNIIITSTPRLSKWLFTFRFWTGTVFTLCHMLYLFHLLCTPLFDKLDNIWWEIQVTDFLVRLFYKQTLTLSGKLRSFEWQIFKMFKKNVVLSSTESVIMDFFGLRDPEDEGTMLHRNTGKYSPFGTV
jgi:hypothetical protein